MYQAYHYKFEKRKKSYWKYIFFIVLLIGLGFLVFKYKKQIALQFTGNTHQKFVKVENKIISEFTANNLKKETLVEFISIASTFLQFEPLNPKSSYGMSKSFYYSLIKSELELNLKDVYEFIFIPKGKNSSLEKLVEGMHRHALRAKIFEEKFPEEQANLLLILLAETLSERTNPNYILKRFTQIEESNLTPDLLKAYVWVGLVNSINSGNLDELQIILDKNTNLKDEFKIFISEREQKLLLGYTLYKNKEFVRALEILRQARGEELDFVTIESLKLEAQIFYEQNLINKSLALLNDLDKKLSYKDESIKKLLINFSKKKE